MENIKIDISNASAFLSRKNKSNNTLLILGNGLDLSAGLNSRYSDYFYLRSEQSQTIEQLKSNHGDFKYSISDFINNNLTDSLSFDDKVLFHLREIDNINFWEIPEITYNEMTSSDNYSSSWSGVEESIQKIIEKFVFSDQKLIEEFNRIKNMLVRQDRLIVTDSFIIYIIYGLLYIDTSIAAEEKNDESYENAVYSLSKVNLFDFLLNELEKFESNFSNYLSYEITVNGYREKITNRIKELIERDTLINILSFNYTNYNFTEINNAANIVNIHGNLEEHNIIFGVDANLYDISKDGIKKSDIKNVDYSGNSVKRFTKTYRIMGKTGDDVEILDNNINTIKFFGHSLSDADFSYFQSIFDYYNIYKNQIKLIFYFERFNDSEETNQKNNIYELMHRYGKTLDNKEHGKNILHKLLIEGRIQLKEITFD